MKNGSKTKTTLYFCHNTTSFGHSLKTFSLSVRVLVHTAHEGL